MRRLRAAPVLLPIALCAALATLAPAESRAQGRPQHGGARQTPVRSAGGPPHAWLFGTWTGGLFPVLDGMTEQDCRTQPTVVFAQDVVGHTSLTAAALVQRVIETARTSPSGTEFRFSPDAEDISAFGCEDVNVLHVARETDSTISFPHCAAFPYPLQRCPMPGR